MVRIVDIPKQAKNTINNDATTPIGIDLLGVFASSPAVAIQSKPIKAKKHLAAPVIIPWAPYGTKPPVPAPGGTSS